MGMSDVYSLNSLNPQILPPTNISKEEHHRFIRTGIFAFVATVLVVIGYLYIASQRTAPVETDDRARLREEVSALLRSISVQANPQEIDRMTVELSKYDAAADANSAGRESVREKLRMIK